MRTGDVIYTRKVEAEFTGDGVRGKMGFKARKGERFVFIALGVERDGDPMDPVEALYELGWSHPEFPDPRSPTPSAVEARTPTESQTEG